MRMRGACPLPPPRHPHGADDGSSAPDGPGGFGDEKKGTGLLSTILFLKEEGFFDGILRAVDSGTTYTARGSLQPVLKLDVVRREKYLFLTVVIETSCNMKEKIILCNYMKAASFLCKLNFSRHSRRLWIKTPSLKINTFEAVNNTNASLFYFFFFNFILQIISTSRPG